MAESESGQDKTEEPTEKRRREAREKGQLPRSRELNTLAILMAGAGGLLIYGADLAGALLRLMRSNFELSRETAMNTESMLQLLGASAYLAAQGLWPILLMLLVAAFRRRPGGSARPPRPRSRRRSHPREMPGPSARE